jgi:hypothetical protein
MHSLKAAAHAVGMHPRTLRRWIADGKVAATKTRGSNGEAWYLDRDQLDRLRTIAARDVEPVADVMPAATPARLELDDNSSSTPAAPGGALVAQPFDLAGLVGAVAAAVGVERQLQVQAAGFRAQLDAERRRADDAADATAHARAMLEDALALIAELRRQIDADRHATTPATTTRATQPIDRAALALVSGSLGQ